MSLYSEFVRYDSVESKTCFGCGREITDKNEIGLNKKIFGRNIVKFHCYECLAESLEVTTDELFAKIEEFKNQGCKLFE
jgi:hypothetical protein